MKPDRGRPGGLQRLAPPGGVIALVDKRCQLCYTSLRSLGILLLSAVWTVHIPWVAPECRGAKGGVNRTKLPTVLSPRDLVRSKLKSKEKKDA
jgi:hypothetical protein